MPNPKQVTREDILHALTGALQPLPYVDALWEAGAAAFNRVDEWSDLDLYVVVANDKVAETFRAIEDALTCLSPIQQRYEPPWPPDSGTAQAFYRLENASEYLLVDLAIFKRSAPDKFLERELHGDAVFAFNNGNAVVPPPLDIDAFVKGLLDRRDRLVARMELFGPFVSKELHRHNWLEALDLYRGLVLDSLVQVLRMRHHPAHHAFKMRYVHYELPPEVIQRLERLSFVRDPEDLEARAREAIAWFHDEAARVTEPEVRARLESV